MASTDRLRDQSEEEAHGHASEDAQPKRQRNRPPRKSEKNRELPQGHEETECDGSVDDE